MFEIDASGNRAKRLTTGSSVFTGSQTRLKVDVDSGSTNVEGIFYTPGESSEPCAAKPESFYTSDFFIKCDYTDGAKRTDPLNYANLQVSVDPVNACLFHVVATHKVGCPVIEYGGFIQFIKSDPYIIAAVLLVFGIVSTFFGGLLFDWVVASIAGIFAFLVTCALASSIGAFTALQSRTDSNGNKIEATGGQIAMTVFAFLVAFALALAAGWFVKKTTRIAVGVLGGIAGVFGAFILYSLILAQFVKNPYVLWAMIIIGAIAGAYLTFRFKQTILIQLTALVGAYALIRSIALFTKANYPSEMEMFSQMAAGNFELPTIFYAFCGGFVVLTVVGTIVQWKLNYQDHIKHVSDEDYVGI